MKKAADWCLYLLVTCLFLGGTWYDRAGNVEVDWDSDNGFSVDDITINTGDEVDIYNYDDTFDLQVTGASPESFYVDVPPTDGVDVYYAYYVYSNPGTFSFSDEFGDSVTVTVDAAEALSVSITAPTNDAVFTAPATFTITAEPAGGATPYAEVDFYVGTNLAGSAYSSPFSLTVTNLTAGSYDLSAVAIDNDFDTATNSILIDVVSAALPPQLTATLTGKQIVVSWPTDNSSGFSVQASARLGLGASWTTVSSTPVQVGNQWVLTNSISGSSQFFRLYSQ